MDDPSNNYVTPPEFAREMGVSPDKVHAWIRSGELEAINVARNGGMRPRFIIEEAAIGEFKRRRSGNKRKSPVSRRRRKSEHVIEFF